MLYSSRILPAIAAEPPFCSQNPGSKYIVAECVEKRTPKRRAVEWISWNLIVSRLEPWLFLAVEEKGCPEERLLVDGFCVGEKPDALRIIDPQYVPPSQ